MVIDVIFEGDERSNREAQNSNPPGMIARLPRRFTSSTMVHHIIWMSQCGDNDSRISVLRFHRIPFEQIFPFSADSPLSGGGSARLTTPEENDLLRLNRHFFPGRANVIFINCNVDLDACFLRNPTLRQKLWSNVSLFEAINERSRTRTDISYAQNSSAR
jgi:hypothetical protein